MGFEDRHYRQVNYGGGQGGGQRRMGLNMPAPTPVVKYLLIINVVAFIVQCMANGRLELIFAATGDSMGSALQAWRLITFQFLHDTSNLMHLVFNMLGVYFLGPTLERSWGGKGFLKFYLTCGAVGGVIYVVASLLGWMGGGTLIGASGGVLGMLVACAILFPQFVVFLFIFPVPIRFAAILFTILYLLNIIRGGPNAGGDLCHLGGMATGFLWIMARPYFAGLQEQRQQGAFDRKQQRQANQQYEVDRILAKVHEKGIQSLSKREKQVLQQATEAQKHNVR